MGTLLAMVPVRQGRRRNLTPSIRERFLADHRKLESILDNVLGALASGDGAEVPVLWGEFERRLLSHLEAEEMRLLPELSGLPERTARVLFQEHRHIRVRLAGLGNLIRSGMPPVDSIRNFSSELRAHARTEDRLLYQWADGHLDEACVGATVAALEPRAPA